MGIVGRLGDSFRYLFAPESERKLRRAQAISRTEAVLEQARKRYESHARRYREKAVEALRIGSQSSYDAFKRDLKRCIGSERRLSQLQLAFAGAVQRAEETQAMSEFCQGVTAVSRALEHAMRGVDLSAALKNFSAVITKTQDVESGIDEFLNITTRMSMSEGMFAGGEELVTDKEVDDLLRREAAMVEGGEAASGMDVEISKEMLELDKLQKELGVR